MKGNVDLSEISDGRLYSANDMVKVECGDCAGCSACCQNMGTSVVLDPMDIWKMQRGTGRMLEKLLKKELELNVVDGIILPNLRMNGTREVCSFLNEEGRCSIHPYRPGICRLFPLGRYYEKNGFHYFLQIDECRKKSRGKMKVKKWLGIENLKTYETYISRWHEFLNKSEDGMKELDEQNIPYKKDIEVGIMVETAAASLMADVFAKEAAFFSIGTNDLTQYTMSVDRGNDKVSYLYSTFNPAVLRSIKRIITCGREAGIMVGMCGEAASDPLMIPLLLAFGLNEFSMSASAILYSRKLITGYSTQELQAVADKAMSFATAAEVELYMREFMAGQA